MPDLEPSRTIHYRLRDVAVLLAAVVVAGAAGLNAGWFLAVPAPDSKSSIRESTPAEPAPQAAAAPATAPAAVQSATSSAPERGATDRDRNIRVIMPGPPTADFEYGRALGPATHGTCRCAAPRNTDAAVICSGRQHAGCARHRRAASVGMVGDDMAVAAGISAAACGWHKPRWSENGRAAPAPAPAPGETVGIGSTGAGVDAAPEPPRARAAAPTEQTTQPQRSDDRQRRGKSAPPPPAPQQAKTVEPPRERATAQEVQPAEDVQQPRGRRTQSNDTSRPKAKNQDHNDKSKNARQRQRQEPATEAPAEPVERTITTRDRREIVVEPRSGRREVVTEEEPRRGRRGREVVVEEAPQRGPREAIARDEFRPQVRQEYRREGLPFFGLLGIFR